MLTGTADATIAKGLETLDEEVALDALAVEGELPGLARGHAACATARRGSRPAAHRRHWFDGLAMLHRFAFADGRVVLRQPLPAHQRVRRRAGGRASATASSPPTRAARCSRACTSMFQPGLHRQRQRQRRALRRASSSR